MDLVEIISTRIISKVLGISNSKENWRALIIHEPSARLLHHTMPISEIFAHNIALIERLEEKREQSGEFIGLYFVALDDDVLSKILKDYKDRIYKEYYIVSMNPPSAKQQKKIEAIIAKNEGYRKKGKDYVEFLHKEVAFDFVPLASDLFRCETKFNYYLEEEGYMEEIPRKILGLCEALHVGAVFYSVGGEALKLGQKMDVLFDTVGKKGRNKFVIMERGCDINSALIHFFTFESALWDYKVAGPGYLLLREKSGKDEGEDRKVEGEQSSSDSTSSSGSSESDTRTKKRVDVDEHNELWMSIRNTHLSETNEVLTKHIKEVAKTSEKIEKGDLKKLRRAVKELPSQTKLMKELSIFVKMVEYCVETFNQNDLKEIAVFEQGVCTGKDFDGRRYKDMAKTFFSLMEKQMVTKEDKLRLYLLLLSNGTTLQRNETQRLLDSGRLKKKELDMGEAMKRYLAGRQLSPESEGELEISRYIPVISDILSAVMKNNEAKYMSFRIRGPERGGEVPLNTSLRKREFVFKGRSMKATAQDKNLVIVYFIGGVSISEITAIREISKKTGMRILVGSTEVYNAGGFVKMLAGMCRK